MLKRALILLGSVAGLLAAAVATLPWWLGSVFAWQGSKYGATFSEYENVGYDRWALNDLRIEQAGVVVAVDRLEAAHLWLLWRKPQSTVLQVAGVRVELPTEELDPETTVQGTFGPQDLQALLGTLAELLPMTEIDSLTVSGLGEHPLHAADLVWRDFGLAGRAQLRSMENQSGCRCKLRGARRLFAGQ